MSKIFGCILMILGTAFGAGMLALPVVTAHETMTVSLALLFFSWLIMTIGAFSLLEVNLWLPANTNMISMARKTLGSFGESCTWIVYLLLLYSLLCAYLASISDILQRVFASAHLFLSSSVTTCLVLLLFGAIVYKGIAAVDMINRGLMSIKLIAYVVIVVLISRYVNIKPLLIGDYQFHNSAFMVMFTSFGYAIILPSLRNYLGNNPLLLKKVVLIGSFLPLFFYSVWIIVIQGLLGKDALIQMMNSPHINSVLMESISTTIHTGWIASITSLFISICAITAFLGVSVCLTDFIADGLKRQNKKRNKMMVFAIAFLPPLFIVLVFPGIFIKALNYAGILCLLLLIILPLLMLYFGRYKLKFKTERILPYGKKAVLFSLLAGTCLLIVNIKQVI